MIIRLTPLGEDPRRATDGDLQRKLKDLGIYGTVGLEFGLSVLVGLFGGQWLDRKLHMEPWLTLVGLGFGIAAGARTLWRTARRAQRELEAEDQRAKQARRDYYERTRRS